MKHLLEKWHLGLFVLLIGTLCSCTHSFLFDGEGDCGENEGPGPAVPPNEPVYKVQFVYDYNINYADAFAQQVSNVTLYVIDSGGNIVWQKTEEGGALAQAGYMMEVDVPSGYYSLLTWCGTKDYGSFTVTSATVATDLQCTLNRSYSADGTAYVDTELDRWFHGYLEQQEFPAEEGEYIYTVPLVKDTNLVHVTLQQASGAEIDVDNFLFSITDDNGLMDWDNSLIPDEEITYYPWYTGQGTRDIDPYSTRATYNTALANMTTARLVKGNNPYLTVLNKETDEQVFSIPLIDYLLLIKSDYDPNMSDQEFLDREDEWEITFFLDDGERWIDAYIYINSWKVVLQSSGL